MSVVCPNCDTTITPIQLHGMRAPQCGLCGVEMVTVSTIPAPTPVPAPDHAEVDEPRVTLLQQHVPPPPPPFGGATDEMVIRHLRDALLDKRAEIRRACVAGACIDLNEQLTVRVPLWHLERLLDKWEGESR